MGLSFRYVSFSSPPFISVAYCKYSTTPTIALFPTSSSPSSLCPPRLIAPPFRHRQAAGTAPPGPLEVTNHLLLDQRVAAVLSGNSARALGAEDGRVRSVHET